ncbi:hypothetical protein [Singulisphaera sp. PoT]|uniref:hypothetical protein n=1 Tax=Singulisphaera sp. PoT TaxID=3411797 RepID=UPI003BF5945E
MASIHQRKPGSNYTVSFWYQGKQFTRKTGTKLKRDAEIVLARVEKGSRRIPGW